MNLYQKYKTLLEGVDYDSGTGYTARVVKTSKGKHVAKFFKDGKHMTDADYEGADMKDAHEFAADEIAHREKKLFERINMPQGHEVVPDRIADGALEKRGRVKKMMGNRMPIEIIAKILAKGTE
jgi:hypothetical protein